MVKRHSKILRIPVVLMMAAWPLIIAGPGSVFADTVLTPSESVVSTSISQHPDVVAANARACQAIHRLGLSKARARPQISLSISGGRQLIERIKGQNGRPDNRGPRESGFRTVTQPSGAQVRVPLEDEEISGAHKRDYNHRARDNLYDGTVTVRYNLIDWGQSRAEIETNRLRHLAHRIDANEALSERAFQLSVTAIRLAFLRQLLQIYQDGEAKLDEQVEVVEARVRAGVGRLSELRQIKLLALENEIERNRLFALREQLIETIAIDYQVTVDDLAQLYDIYRHARPAELPFLEPSKTEQARALRLQIEAVTHEERQIKGARYPKIDAVFDGTLFDLGDYEDEYELVGKLEFKMPLYDGGTARARLRETGWRVRELRSRLTGFERKHAAEMEQATRRFNDLTREINEEADRRSELLHRFDSLSARQGQTESSPTEVAMLLRQITMSEAKIIELRSEQSVTRARVLSLAEALTPILNITRGDKGC
jgi:outer membrane protein TolC